MHAPLHFHTIPVCSWLLVKVPVNILIGAVAQRFIYPPYHHQHFLLLSLSLHSFLTATAMATTIEMEFKKQPTEKETCLLEI